jgi:hypothetical protein
MHTSLSLPETHTALTPFPSHFHTKTLPSHSLPYHKTHTHTHFFLHCQLTHIQKHHHTHFISNTHVTFTMHPCCITPKHTLHLTKVSPLLSSDTHCPKHTHTHTHFHLFFLYSLFSLLTYKHSLPTIGRIHTAAHYLHFFSSTHTQKT